MPECPSCHGNVPLGRNVCPFCRSSLALPCPFCGNMLPGLVRHCPRCRQRLDLPADASATPPVPARPVERAPDRPVERAPERPVERAVEPERRGESEPAARARPSLSPARARMIAAGGEPPRDGRDRWGDEEAPAPRAGLRQAPDDEGDERRGGRSSRDASDDEPASRRQPTRPAVRTWGDLERRPSVPEDDEPRPARRADPSPAEEEPRPRRSAEARPVRTWGDLGRTRVEEDEPETPRRPSRLDPAEDERPPARLRRLDPAEDERPPARLRRLEDEEPSPRRPARSFDEEPVEPATTSSRGPVTPPPTVAPIAPIAPPAPPAATPAAVAPAAATPAGAPRPATDESLSRAVHDELFDWLFADARSMLERRNRSASLVEALEAVDPQAFLAQLEQRAEQLPRRALAALRRHGGGEPRLDEVALGRLVARAQLTIGEAWQDVAEARRLLEGGVAVAQDDAREYLGALFRAAGTDKPAARFDGTRGPGLLVLVGPALEGPFRPGAPLASGTPPRRLLGAQHAALRQALQATDEAWLTLFDAFGEAVAAAGGPRLTPGAALWASGEELTRLKLRAQTLLEENEPRKALKVVEMARAKEPREPSLAVLGLSIAMAAHHKDDCDLYAGVLERDFPDHVPGLVARTELLQLRGEKKPLVALLERGLTLEPTNQALREGLARQLMKNNDQRAALKLLEPLCRDFPRAAEYQMLRARAHGLLDQQEGALDGLLRYAALVDLDQDKVNKIKADEAFDCLAANERFEALLRAQLDLLALADTTFTADNKTFYFGEDLPPRKLKNAQSSWLTLEPGESLVFVIDTTFLGRCTEGVAVTDHRLLWKDLGAQPEQYELSRLRPEQLKTQDGKVWIGKRTINLIAQPYLLSPMLQYLLTVARSNG